MTNRPGKPSESRSRRAADDTAKNHYITTPPVHHPDVLSIGSSSAPASSVPRVGVDARVAGRVGDDASPVVRRWGPRWCPAAPTGSSVRAGTPSPNRSQAPPRRRRLPRHRSRTPRPAARRAPPVHVVLIVAAPRRWPRRICPMPIATISSSCASACWRRWCCASVYARRWSRKRSPT